MTSNQPAPVFTRPEPDPLFSRAVELHSRAAKAFGAFWIERAAGEAVAALCKLRDACTFERMAAELLADGDHSYAVRYQGYADHYDRAFDEYAARVVAVNVPADDAPR